MPNPEAALDEFARVLRPGGEMVLLSRIGAEAGLRRNIEHLLQPVVRRLGWRTEFSFERSPLGRRHARHAPGGAPSGPAVRALLSASLCQERSDRIQGQCRRLSDARMTEFNCHLPVIES